MTISPRFAISSIFRASRASRATSKQQLYTLTRKLWGNHIIGLGDAILYVWISVSKALTDWGVFHHSLTQERALKKKHTTSDIVHEHAASGSGGPPSSESWVSSWWERVVKGCCSGTDESCGNRPYSLVTLIDQDLSTVLSNGSCATVSFLPAWINQSRYAISQFLLNMEMAQLSDL